MTPLKVRCYSKRDSYQKLEVLTLVEGSYLDKQKLCICPVSAEGLRRLWRIKERGHAHRSRALRDKEVWWREVEKR